MRGAKLVRAILRMADLRSAKLCGADPDDAGFIGAELVGAVVDKKFLEKARLSRTQRNSVRISYNFCE